jgi:hypothetical protein
MKYATLEPMRATNDEELATLVQHLQQQSATRRDYVVPVKDISAVLDEDEMVKFAFKIAGDQPPVLFEPTYRAHETMWDRLDIPKAYYLRMGESAPDLLAENVNYWTQRSGKNYLARTLDNKVRAFMSDRFRSLDSVELFFTAFQEAKDLGVKIVRADYSETRFYMRILHPEWAERMPSIRMDMNARRKSRDDGGHRKPSVLDHLSDDDGGGSWLVPGVVVQNSDVGYGSLNAELFIQDLTCMNGTIGDRLIHKVHLGGELDLGFVSDETRQLRDQAIWSEVRDMMKMCFDEDKFKAYMNKFVEAAEIQLENPVEAVNLVVRNNSLDESDQQAILNELMAGGNNSVYGLLSAVTAVGRDKSNYDDGIRFERIGGDILRDPREFIRVRRSARSARQIQQES